jgi:hypothetical protein
MTALPTDPELGKPGLPGDCGTECDIPQCDQDVFTRFNVDHIVIGGTRVSWELDSGFLASAVGPLEFQLQAGRTANPLADDWEAVGLTAFDTWFMIDDQKRLFGKTFWTHYRICLRTGDNQTLFSKPVSALMGLDRRDWRIFREIRRKELVNFRFGGTEGYLLKRRTHGTKCTECRDFQSGEILDDDCDTCYGTGFVNGYYPPMPCIFAITEPMARHEERDGGQARGTINDIKTSARMLALPHMNEQDIWVARRQDRRWVIHRVQDTSEIKGVPLIAKVELRLLPTTDQIYTINIPGQVPDP